MVVIRPSSAGRDWNALSDSYRHRLERSGISRRDYERGASVSAARGHAETPEHPSRATSESHPAYTARRERLLNEVAALKADVYSGRAKYNEQRSRKALDIRPTTGKKRGIASLKRLRKKYIAMLSDEPEEDYDGFLEGDDNDGDFYH